MTIINRYLFNAIVGSTLIVLLVLLSLGGFIEFVTQLDDLGQGDYDMLTAMQYVLLKLPRMASGLLPVSVLLGALLGLGALASGSELIVLQASGVSAYRLARSVAVTGMIIAAIGGIIGEFIAPQMDLYARQLRAVAKSGQADMSGMTGSSAWLREGDSIFNVRPSIDGVDFGGVYVYRMKEPGKLSGIGRAESAELNEEWALSDYRESVLSPRGGVSVKTDFDSVQIDVLRDLLSITAVRESSLTAAELYNYVRYLKKNSLDAERYEIAFWGRIATAAGVAVMCVLALPFVFGSLRSTGAGARMIVGVLIGVGYFLLNRTFADSGAVFNLSPILVAWLPTALLAVVTLFALRRLSRG